MKLNQKIGLVFLFLLFLIPSALAVKQEITVNQESSGGLSILYPNKKYHEFNQDYDFYFHVFNSTNHLINNTYVNCTFHLYDPVTGAHILETYPQRYNGIEFEVELDNTILTKIGTYEFNLWCNATNGEAGFESNAFTVTLSGFGDEDPASLLAVIFIPLVLAFILIFGSSSMSEDHNVLRIFMFLLSISCVLISFWFGTILVVNYYNLAELQEAIGTTTFILASVYFVLIAYFIFYAVFKTKEYFFNKKKEKDEGLNY